MATSTPTKTVHLQILVKKADHLSTEQFHAYWLTAHPQIWLGVPIVRANVVRYAQFHVDAGTTASLSAVRAIYPFSFQLRWGKGGEEEEEEEIFRLSRDGNRNGNGNKARGREK